MKEGLAPLIDCDVLVYRCGFAADSQVRNNFKQEGLEGDDLQQALRDTDYTAFALNNVKTVFEDVFSKFSGEYKAYLSGEGNFREQVATILPYKGNRDPAHKPKYYHELKRYLIEHWGAEVVNGREADDAIGCEQWRHKDRSTIICTIDKDLDSIPGYHYNFRTGDIYDIDVNTANLFHFKQMMTGDRVDNIPGIKGIGDIKAEKILALNDYDLSSVRAAVQDLYKKQYGDDWQRAYEEVSMLLWIQRVEGKTCPFLW